MKVIEIIKKIIIGIFDFARDVIEGTSKPLNSFLAVSLPLVAAFAMAILTSGNLVKYLGMDSQESKIYAFLFEGLAIFVFTQLVTAIVSWVKSKNSKTIILIWILSILAICYMAVIISVNVSLQSVNGVEGIDIFVYFMLSLMTPITGISYGYYLLVMKDNEEHMDSKNLAETIRLEKVAEQQRRWNVKHGVPTNQGMQMYNVDENGVSQNQPFLQKEQKQKFGSDYKDKVIQMLEEVYISENKILSPSEITERINKKYKANLVNSNVKGFWSKTTSDWRANKGI
jgi:hypothetical protein